MATAKKPSPGRRLVLCAAMASLPVLMSACSTGGTGQSGPVTGHLLEVGGPWGQSRPLSGTLIFTDPSGVITKEPVPASGSFRHDVPARTYTLAGTSPGFNDAKLTCYADPTTVMVEAKTTTTHNVLCHIR